jgi:hypothetical protein
VLDGHDGERPLAPTFFSKLDRAIKEKIGAKMPAGQAYRTLLAAGVKPEEMDYSGVGPMLESRGQEMVTRQELLDHNAENQVQIHEKWRVERDSPEYQDRLNDLRADRDFGFLTEDEYQKEVDALQKDPMLRAPLTHYDRYKMPGGSNYHELLLTLPYRKDGENYSSSHWDELNVLAHVRFDERKGRDGGQVLLLGPFG